MGDLLPCPFCGAKDEAPNRFGLAFHSDPDRDGCFLCCSKCFAEGPLVEPADKAAAIAAWNRRVNPAERARDEALRIARLAKNYRDLEIEQTPRMLRGKDLHELGLKLSDELDTLFPEAT